MNNLRIILTEEQSAAFREHGITFAVAGPGSYPDAPGRIALYCFPCSQQQAQDACDVARGEATARKATKPTLMQAIIASNEPKPENAEAIRPATTNPNKTNQ